MLTDLRLAGSPNAQRRCGVSRGWRTERWWTARRHYFFFFLVFSRGIWVVDQKGKTGKWPKVKTSPVPSPRSLSRHRNADTVTLLLLLRSAGEPEESCCPGEGWVTSRGAGPNDARLPPNAVFVYLYFKNVLKDHQKYKTLPFSADLHAKKDWHGFKLATGAS